MTSEQPEVEGCRSGRILMGATAGAAEVVADFTADFVEEYISHDKAREVETKRVLQRSLIAQFREYVQSEVQNRCTQTRVDEAPVGKKTTLARTPSMSAVALSRALRNVSAETEVALVSSGAGDERANCHWREVGLHQGRTRFVSVADADVHIMWSKESKEWQLGLGKMHHGEILYRLKDTEVQMKAPLSGWEPTQLGQGPGPAMLEPAHVDYFEVFAKAWAEEPPELDGVFCALPRSHSTTSEEPRDSQKVYTPRKDSPRALHWSQIRGPYGETVLSWLWIMQSHDNNLRSLQGVFKSIILGIIRSDPVLVGVAMTGQPYVGETILHQVCATGDVAMVDVIVNNAEIRRQNFFQDTLLEGRMTGSFLSDILLVPERLHPLYDAATPEDSSPEQNGATALEVAILAPHNDEDSVAIVALLIKAGASPIFRESSTGEVRYNILHIVARSAWWDGWELAPHMSQSRTQSIVKMFMSPHAELFHNFGKLMQSMPNKHDHTPLQVAAMFGNQDCFLAMLEFMKVPVWDWGKKKEVGFPLVELDSGARDAEIGALELMTLYKHGNLLSLGLMAELVHQKWERFGEYFAHRYVLLQMVCCLLTAVVVLDDTDGYSFVRLHARTVVIMIAAVYVVGGLLIFAICASDEQWFRHMDKNPFSSSPHRINMWELLAVRNVIEMALMGILVVSPPWYVPEELREHSMYKFIWHSFASAWFLMFIMFSLRYFELFRKTTTMAAILPEVIWRDLVPFGTFYLVILICSSVSLRISVELQKENAEPQFSSFRATFYTLEEAIHGPDVQWRTAVEHHPRVAGMIFVAFLWVTLIMMSILIAMFGNTWDSLEHHVNERFLYRRATFCITQEKLMPQWFHRSQAWWGSSGCSIGHPLGSAGSDARAEDIEDEPIEAISARSGILSSPRSERDVEAAEEGQPLLGEGQDSKDSGRSEDRWLLWSGGEKTFGNWRSVEVWQVDDVQHL